jgi:hypothetical protein
MKDTIVYMIKQIEELACKGNQKAIEDLSHIRHAVIKAGDNAYHQMKKKDNE